MAGLAINVAIDDKALLRRLKDIRNFKTAALKPIAMALVRGTTERFRREETPEGVPWKPLSPDFGLYFLSMFLHVGLFSVLLGKQAELRHFSLGLRQA